MNGRELAGKLRSLNLVPVDHNPSRDGLLEAILDGALAEARLAGQRFVIDLVYGLEKKERDAALD